jgi:hypothetical protein
MNTNTKTTNNKVDLTSSFPSWSSSLNDALPNLPKDSRLDKIGRLNYYACNKDLQNQYVSPIFGDFSGLKIPVLVQGKG